MAQEARVREQAVYRNREETYTETAADAGNYGPSTERGDTTTTRRTPSSISSRTLPNLLSRTNWPLVTNQSERAGVIAQGSPLASILASLDIALALRNMRNTRVFVYADNFFVVGRTRKDAEVRAENLSVRLASAGSAHMTRREVRSIRREGAKVLGYHIQRQRDGTRQVTVPERKQQQITEEHQRRLAEDPSRAERYVRSIRNAYCLVPNVEALFAASPHPQPRTTCA